MIEVANLSKRYGDTLAVDGVSFQVGRGEVVGFLGPNGAGKSTTMKILTCFLPASSGTARIAGFDVFKQSHQVRQRIGYLPENVPLYPEMRVEEYLMYRAALKRVPRSERRKRVRNVMEQCWLSDAHRKVIGHLSKGYRQRVGLADSLVHHPEILILDEPTVGLDPNQIRQARHLIRELGREHTILLSTHILSEVEMICERFLIIHRGRIAAQDSLEDLAARSGVIAEIAGDHEDVLHTLRGIREVKDVDVAPMDGGYRSYRIFIASDIDVRETVYRISMTKNWKLRELRQHRPSLEELFVRITTQEDGRDA